jgi:phytanoyl-CoA hydroxylase
VYTPLETWVDLSTARYHQDGFAAVAQAFTAQQIDDARGGLTDLIMGKVPDFEGIQFEASVAARLQTLSLSEREVAVRKLMTFCAYEARLDALMRHPQLLAIITKLLGDREPVCFQEMALLKPPHGREKPWHQDHAYFNLQLGEPVVGVWIALDEATAENGCMHVIPGSHRAGAVVHFKRRDWQICDSSIAGNRITAVPLKPGGLMLFDGLLQHGTPHNPTNQRRRALQFHYCAKDAKWTDEQARLAVFGSEGKDVTC